MSSFYKYYPPAKANYSLRQDTHELINYYQIPSRFNNKDIKTNQYIVGASIVKDKSFPNNQQKLVIHQTKLKDLKDNYLIKKIHRNVLIPSLPIGLFLESEKRMVSSVWYYVVNQKGEIDILEAFNSFGFLAKHYLLEREVPIAFGGEILVKRVGNKKVIVFNHLSGNYSKTLIDNVETSFSKKTLENRLTRLTKKIFEKHLDFYKTKMWKFKDKWITDIVLEYTPRRAFDVYGLPPQIEIDYWCQNFPKRIFISEANQTALLWKASKSKALPKITEKKLKSKDISEKLGLDTLKYLC